MYTVKEKGGKHHTTVLEIHTETSSLRTFKIMPRNLNKIVCSWIWLQYSTIRAQGAICAYTQITPFWIHFSNIYIFRRFDYPLKRKTNFFRLDTKTYVKGVGGGGGYRYVGKKRPKRLRVYKVVNTYCTANSPKHCGKTFIIQNLSVIDIYICTVYEMF